MERQFAGGAAELIGGLIRVPYGHLEHVDAARLDRRPAKQRLGVVALGFKPGGGFARQRRRQVGEGRPIGCRGLVDRLARHERLHRLVGVHEVERGLDVLARQGRDDEARGVADVGGRGGAVEQLVVVEHGVARAGELIGDQGVADARQRCLETGEVAVGSGERRAGVGVAGVDRPGLVRRGLQQQIGQSGGRPGCKLRFGAAERIAVQPVEILGQPVGVDRLAGSDADAAEDVGRIPGLRPGRGFRSQAELQRPHLQDPGGDVLFGRRKVDEWKAGAAVLSSDLRLDLGGKLSAQRPSQEPAERARVIGKARGSADIDANRRRRHRGVGAAQNDDAGEGGTEGRRVLVGGRRRRRRDRRFERLRRRRRIALDRLGERGRRTQDDGADQDGERRLRPPAKPVHRQRISWAESPASRSVGRAARFPR